MNRLTKKPRSYRVVALDSENNRRTMIIEAAGRDAVQQRLAAENLFELEVTLLQQQKIPQPGLFELSLIYRELSELLTAGLNITESLQVMSASVTSADQNHHHAGLIQQLLARINTGMPLHRSMQEVGVFPRSHLFSLKAAENSGVLPATLGRLADITETLDEFREKILTAALYPLAILAVSALLLIFLAGYVIPSFEGVYHDLGIISELPRFTRWVLNFSSFIKLYWPGFAGLLAALIILGPFLRRQLYSFKPAARYWGRLQLKLPFIGEIYRLYWSMQLSFLLSLLQSSGLEIIESLNLTIDSIQNPALAAELSRVPGRVARGSSLTDALSKVASLDPLIIRLVAIGENTGNLSKLLLTAADIFSKRIRTRISRLTAALEPALIIIVGLFIAIMVLSVFMPIIMLGVS